MPEEQTRQITGDDIISEILRNCEAGVFKIRQTALLPSIYHVYVHPADLDMIRAVIPAVTAEARAALAERLEQLNVKSKPSSIARALGFEGASKPVTYRILDADWTIEFHPDAEEKLSRGDIEIFSELASAAPPDFEGAMTRHVTRRRSDGSTQSYSQTAPTMQAAPPGAGDDVYGTIRYTDATGPKSFTINKNQIVIGRGGKTFWIDLKLDAPPDVSREHCRIRRDPATGQFFLKDVSQFGTAVNGRRVPSSIEQQGGEDRDKNVEVSLPERATITLADVFTLEFEARAR